jgi:hypothetical protein
MKIITAEEARMKTRAKIKKDEDYELTIYDRALECSMREIDKEANDGEYGCLLEYRNPWGKTIYANPEVKKFLKTELEKLGYKVEINTWYCFFMRAIYVGWAA